MSHNVYLTGIEQVHLNKRTNQNSKRERATEGENDFCSGCELAWAVDPKHLSIENHGLQDRNNQGFLAKPMTDV